MNFVSPVGSRGTIINLDKIVYIAEDKTAERKYTIMFDNGVTLSIIKPVYEKIKEIIINNGGMKDINKKD